MNNSEFMEIFDQLTPENQQLITALFHVMADPHMEITHTQGSTPAIRWDDGCTPDPVVVSRAQKLLELCPGVI